MARLRMVDEGYPFKKIMQGSKWIGRVYKNAAGTWVGQIGKNASRVEAIGATPLEAFMEVGARFFGQANAAALAAHNSAVRSHNRQRRAQGRSLIDDFLRRLDDVRVARGRAYDNRTEVARVARDAEQEVNRLEEGLAEDDFVPPRGRQH